MPASFFLPVGPAQDSRWLATAHTAGPWDVRFQHGGPPSALLARAVERTEPSEDLMVARMTVEILGPVPVGELEVSARISRPGRSVQRVEASLTADGRQVATAQAWRIRRTTSTGSGGTLPPALPEPSAWTPPEGWLGGYLSAVEWRPVRGHFATAGPATAWSRLKVALVEGEEPSPLQRVLAVADSANGLSSELDPTTWYFINPELSVHVHREAVGEWICLDAVTTTSAGGVGLATSVLSDLQGSVGVGAQSLLVSPR